MLPDYLRSFEHLMLKDPGYKPKNQQEIKSLYLRLHI